MTRSTERLARLMPLAHHAISHLGVKTTPTGKRLGLTNTRMMALAVVLHGESVTMSELAGALDLPAPLATRTVDELVERDLLERSPDTHDRRRVLVRATDTGRQALDDIHRESGVMLGRVLEQMADEQVDALIEGLEALLEAIHGPDGLTDHSHHD